MTATTIVTFKMIAQSAMSSTSSLEMPLMDMSPYPHGFSSGWEDVKFPGGYVMEGDEFTIKFKSNAEYAGEQDLENLIKAVKQVLVENADEELGEIASVEVKEVVKSATRKIKV